MKSWRDSPTFEDLEEECVCKLLRTLKNSRKIGILKLFVEEKSIFTLSELAQRMNSSAQEIYKELKELTDLRIIARNSYRYYQITGLGMTIYSLMRGLYVLTRLADYFSTHALPSIFIEAFKKHGLSVENFELIQGFHNVFQALSELLKTSDNVDLLFENGLSLLATLLKDQSYRIKGRLVELLPTERSECYQKRKELSSRFSKLQVRYYPKDHNPHPYLAISNEFSVIVLPHLDDRRMDLNSAILLRGKINIYRSRLIFEEYWSKSKELE